MATQSSKNSAKTTPPQWEQFTDARENNNAGQYPNYWVRKTRSGHTMIFDDSQGSESITIQHRSGSMIQFMPDGAVQYVSHNGQQNIIFGENRVLITGAQDTTVRGDASMKVNGKHDMTVDGDMTTAVGGHDVKVAKSASHFYENQFDVQSESMAFESATGVSFSAKGAAAIENDGPFNVLSKSGVGIYGQTGVGIKGSSNVSVETEAILSLIGGPIVAADARLILLNCGASVPVKQAVTFNNPAPSKKQG